MSAASPLTRHPDFLRLWSAQAIAEFGARITREGLPITAVMVLAAGPQALGVLAAVGSAAGLAVGLAAGGPPQFWLTPGGPLGKELHVAFSAPDRAAVDAVHAIALEAGVEVLHAPREWPEYHPGYYGVFLRDPDGHLFELSEYRS